MPGTLAELAENSVTRTGLADTLSTLHKKGLLSDDVLQGCDAASFRRKIKIGMELHSGAETPCGMVVQTIDLGIPELSKWEFCHPLAILHYLSAISIALGELMYKLRDMTLRIVLYIDACDPANPLRADRTRRIECIYVGHS